MSISQEIQRIKTNIANAYTQAKGKGATLPEVQNSANLADTISSIQTGGGTPASVEEKDINFYDYDGTRLYSYTLAEIQELTELPELPSHDGLICQGWNWTLADIKAEGKETDVGAMYITDDGKTRLYITIESTDRATIPIAFGQTVANGVKIDWGDGSAVETFSTISTSLNISHTYTSAGDYVITLDPLDNCELTLGAYNSTFGYKCLIGTAATTTIIIDNYYRNLVKKIEIGKNVTTLNDAVFASLNNLLSITIPRSVTNITESAFQNCYNLSCITIPNNLATNDLPATLFGYCYFLKHCLLPKNAVLSAGIFNSCWSLKNIKISENQTNISFGLFRTCFSLINLIIPSSVTNIGATAFQQCYAMKYYDFSSHTVIPTLSNKNAFAGIPSDCRIIVPDSLYEDWKVATNWSTYASYIIKKSDLEASQV